MSKSKELPSTRRSSLIQKFALLGLSTSAALLFKGDNNLNNAFAGDLSSRSALIENQPALSFTHGDSEQNTKKLREKIADEFGIEIQTFDEISEHPQLKLIYGFENLFPMNQGWNNENLELLEKIFEYVPSSFYKPRNGEKVHVILGPNSHCGHDIKGFTPKYPYEVMLSYSQFKPSKPLTAALVMAHEFGHLMTTESCNSHLKPTYLDQLEEITGENFAQLQEELPVQIKTTAAELGVEVAQGGAFYSVDSLTSEEEEAFRLTRLNYGATNSKEFMAVLFESYFMGKNYFRRMYRPFFEDKTDVLYNFIKGIYNGKEFPDYHVTKAELEK